MLFRSRGSNPRPLESQSRALPTELLPPLPSLLLRQMVRPAGLEPATPGLEGRCSIRLSYGRLPGIVSLVPMENRCPCAGCGCSMPIDAVYRTLLSVRTAFWLVNLASLLAFRHCVPHSSSVRNGFYLVNLASLAAIPPCGGCSKPFRLLPVCVALRARPNKLHRETTIASGDARPSACPSCAAHNILLTSSITRKIGRGREIRTPDPLLPKQMRYQAALCPDFFALPHRLQQ